MATDEWNPLPAVADALSLHYVPGLLEKLGGKPFGGQSLRWSAHVAGTIGIASVNVVVRDGRRHVDMLYGASYPDLDLGLRIRRRLPFSPLRFSVLGSRVDIEPQGAEDLWIRARDAERAREALTPETVAELTDLARELPNFLVTDHTIDATERRARSNLPTPTEIVELIEKCVRVVVALRE